MVFFLIFSSMALAGLIYINLGGSMFADEGEGTGPVTMYALHSSIGNYGDPVETSCPGLKEEDHVGWKQEDLLCDTGSIYKDFATLPPHGSAFLHAPKEGLLGLTISNFVWALYPALGTAFESIEVNKTTIRRAQGCQETPYQTCSGRGKCVDAGEEADDIVSSGGSTKKVCKCKYSHGFEFPIWRGDFCQEEVDHDEACLDNWSQRSYEVFRAIMTDDMVPSTDCAVNGVCAEGKCWCKTGFRGVSCSGGAPPSFLYGGIEAAGVLVMLFAMAYVFRARQKAASAALAPRSKTSNAWNRSASSSSVVTTSAAAKKDLFDIGPELFSIVVCGVPQNASEKFLRSHFEKFGEIEYIQQAWTDTELCDARNSRDDLLVYTATFMEEVKTVSCCCCTRLDATISFCCTLFRACGFTFGSEERDRERENNTGRNEHL